MTEEDQREIFGADHDYTNIEGIIYTFVSEYGRFDIDYRTYLNSPRLMSLISDTNRFRLILGRTIFSYSREYLSRQDKVRALMGSLEMEMNDNPLRFFAPSGKEALAYLNDTANDICILTAPNRTGKTQTMIIKKLLTTVKCDPSWEIFTKYGVKYRPWRGGVKCGISTYELASHSSTIIPMLLDWIPKKELGAYSRDWGGKGGKRVNINGSDPMLPLEHGSSFHFFTITQSQQHFESSVMEDWGWDEQGDEPRFDGADERSRTTSSRGRHDFGLTPHAIEGRPDTGAGSWIHKLYEGTETKGRSVGKYEMNVYDVPDWIYSEESKFIAFKKHILEPKETRNIKAEREGLSRYRGKFHESSGLVIDEFDSTKHIISAFEIPKHWPRFRAVDHGLVHPAACVWATMSPAGDLFIYDEYLRTGRVPTQICADIVEKSGNTLLLIGDYANPKNSMLYSRFQEQQTGTKFQWTVFDGKAFNSPTGDSGLPLSKVYDLAGLRMKKGSGQICDYYVPILKEWFVINDGKKHFETGEPGAPRIYIFNTCPEFIKGIKRWIWTRRRNNTEESKKMSPTKKDDDLMDCMKILIQANPCYVGVATMADKSLYPDIHDSSDSNVQMKTNAVADSITGY